MRGGKGGTLTMAVGEFQLLRFTYVFGCDDHGESYSKLRSLNRQLRLIKKTNSLGLPGWPPADRKFNPKYVTPINIPNVVPICHLPKMVSNKMVYIRRYTIAWLTLVLKAGHQIWPHLRNQKSRRS